ncbi:ABC transporter permease [Asticcacaulis machinosus]|uniref:ABC transporter permease n=1 Tax=Asticcacaulis machinosus TaxID=2984211 RepID=A0ABT5HJR9_9CAUL|nr:ABC transporter permease [Asticcacaulis machinosus]MDC7676492.1 ABC transporter permease [Asticcacaulis machinosus]
MNKTIADLIAGSKLYPVWLHQAYYMLSAKYKRTILGTIWIAGNFIASSLAIAVVFGAIFNQDLHETLPYTMQGFLMAGTCMWIITEAPELYVGHAGIIKNHAYPFTYFAFEGVAKMIMLFAHNLIVFYIFMVAMGTVTVPLWPLIPGLILNIVCMLGWGCVVGMMSARFRDLRFLLPSASTLLFFLTPVYWRAETLGSQRWIADINPLYHMIAIVREPFLGRYPAPENWIFVSGVAVTGIVAWFIAFSLFRRRIPFWV